MIRAVTAVVVRPWLWPVAVVQARRLARPGWWRGWPPVPLPDRAYLRFRMQAMYGDADHEPEPADLLIYLRWCRSVAGEAR